MLFQASSCLPLIALCCVSLASKEGHIIDPDTFRSITELITSRGFEAEEHRVITEDGYIITMQRIVNPFVRDLPDFKAKPLLVVHGLLDTGASFVMNSVGGFAQPLNASEPDPAPEEVGNNLGFVLANKGYDVWLGNVRGNTYSQGHTTLDPKRNKKYWQFSFDQMVDFDLPAFIGHILRTTNESSIGYIGHSQGTLMMFALLASKPEYNDIINPFIALAPVVTIQHFKTPVIELAKIPGELKLLKKLGGPFPPPNFYLFNRIWINVVCRGIVGSNACSLFLFLGVGFDKAQMDKERFRVYASHTPSPTSVQNFVHFVQLYRSNTFAKYDFGTKGNLRVYGQKTPPLYQLQNITSKSIALLSSENDWCADPQDVQYLRTHLKVPLLEDYVVPFKKWNHMDFVWGKMAGKYVNSVVLQILDKAAHRESLSNRV